MDPFPAILVAGNDKRIPFKKCSIAEQILYFLSDSRFEEYTFREICQN